MIPFISEVQLEERAPIGDVTFRLDRDMGRVVGRIDGLEALRQAAYVALQTERYQFPIYGENFGVEIESLRGREVGFVFADLERRVTDALLVDERIWGVSDFTASRQGNTVHAEFTMETIYGHGNMNLEVAIA